MSRGTSDSTVLYRQRTGRVGFRICYALLGALALYGLLSSLDRGIRFALLSALLYPVTLGIPVVVALIGLWSVDVYGAVTLTRDELRVGRTRVPTSDLDLPDLLAQARDRTGLAERWGGLIASTPLPQERGGGHAPMLGGSYGSTLGSPALTVRLEGLGWRRIDTRRPHELLDALLVARSGGPAAA